MKIAVVGVKGLPPKQGGIEHYCAEVYPRIVAQGHSVDLYARSSYTDLPAYYQHDFDGVKVISLPCPGWRGFDAFFSSALGAITSSRKSYDIVHFHALGPSLFTSLPKIVSSSKIVVTCQGLDWQRDKWGNTSSQLILLGEKAAVRFADEIIVVSKALRNYFQETYSRDTVYIPNAPASFVDSDPAFSYGTSLGLTPNRYLVFLGRLVPEKCPDLLIKAFQSLQLKDWKLVLVGGNSDASSFHSSLIKLAADNANIVFAGELLGKRLAEIIRGAGLFVLPSKLEGLPLAMLEAMQQGVPVLASDIPPHQELLENERGLLFEVGNLNHLQEQIIWAINHQAEMTSMAEQARNYVLTHHSWETITQKTLEVFERLLAPDSTLYPSQVEAANLGANKLISGTIQER
ncbi:MAG: glycosyltransferase family 4 protein [Leptolyngbyaceae cyanobacterium bins.59]|nr:glycosyltransferase family 4 protein [Leptolyngbyaceae cyanobacterium bins.59]